VTDKLLPNKWVVLERFHIVRSLVDSFAANPYSDVERALWQKLHGDVSRAIASLTDEVKRQEGRA
jgi:hypothetical protein